MRILLAIILTMAALWSGYWFVGSSAKHTVLTTWFEDRRADGWIAEYSDFRVVGFPNRFDSRFSDLHLKDPRSGLSWKAPLFHILALSYQPNHIIAAFANDQQVSLPGDDIRIESSEMVASVTFEPNTLLAVSQTLLRSKDLRITGATDWQMLAQRLDLSTRQNTGNSLAHDIVFDAADVTPTETFRQRLDPGGNQPAVIERIFLDMALGFTAPWDRLAVETGAPEVTTITLNRIDTVWGSLGLGGNGAFDVAPDGRITGRLKLEIRNWRAVLDLFVTANILDKKTAKTIGNGLEILTLGTDDPGNLKVPLVLKNGQMSLGPIPLGHAPSFVRR